MGNRILVVDDEKEIADVIELYLKNEGFEVEKFYTGKDAIASIEKAAPDMALLDVMLPDGDGFSLYKVMRETEKNRNTPVIFLSARDEDYARLKGLGLGADDYMTKPPDRQELVLRIKALLRRARIVDEHRITIGDVELDYDTHTVRRGHDAQVLPPKEFNLLYKLLAYPERTFTRLELLDEIWGMDSESDDKTVNVHINRLRTRFYDWPEFEIQTIRGIGYRAIKKV